MNKQDRPIPIYTTSGDLGAYLRADGQFVLRGTAPDLQAATRLGESLTAARDKVETHGRIAAEAEKFPPAFRRLLQRISRDCWANRIEGQAVVADVDLRMILDWAGAAMLARAYNPIAGDVGSTAPRPPDAPPDAR